MLPVLRRVGSPVPWRDPFAMDDAFGLSRDLLRLTDTLLSDFPFGLGSSWSGPARLDSTTWGVLPAEVKETEEAYTVTLDAPGFSEDDLDVTVDGSHLRVRARRQYENQEEGVRYWLRERRIGHFERTFMIPESVDKDHIEVAYMNGVLEITMPKREGSRPRRLKISKPNLLNRLTSGRKKEKEKAQEAEEVSA